MRTRTISLLLPVFFLSACGGGTTTPTPDTTPFTLAVSDAPVDNAVSVMVYFDKVTLEGNGDPVTIDVRDANGQPRAVDLLKVQGSDFASIIDGQSIPTGQYSQLRLSVTADSYIEMASGTYPLKVPSGELKLDGITALPNVTAAYTIEFDLRKSIVDPVGQQAIYLKPRGVRLVANDKVGVLDGTVSDTLINDPSCTNKTDPTKGNAVYIYSGKHTDISLLGDDADNPADANEVSPLTTADVTYNDQTKAYEFEAGYVPTGDYTVAFTCQAAIDMPETDENAADGFTMLSMQQVTVSAKQTTTVTFQPPQ